MPFSEINMNGCVMTLCSGKFPRAMQCSINHRLFDRRFRFVAQNPHLNTEEEEFLKFTLVVDSILCIGSHARCTYIKSLGLHSMVSVLSCFSSRHAHLAWLRKTNSQCEIVTSNRRFASLVVLHLRGCSVPSALSSLRCRGH